MKGRTSIPLLVGFLLVCSIANGALTTITFDEFGLTPGFGPVPISGASPAGTIISDQFKSLGVDFGLLGDPATAYLSSLSIGPCAACTLVSGNYLAFNTHGWFTDPPPTSQVGILEIRFVEPTSGLPWLAFGSSISMVIADTEFSVTLRSYDASDTLLETLFFSSGPSVDVIRSFSSGLVRRIEVVDVSGDGFFLDNLQFELIPIPEPATFALLGTALVGLGLWKRCRRKTASR